MMYRTMFTVVCLLLSSGPSFSQHSDATVVVHQSTLNGFLNAVGPINGTDEFKAVGMKGKYTWTLKNARIELRPGQAQFTADASVKVGPLEYGSVANGNVDVSYDQLENRIRVKVAKATFEVYTKVFGKKVHLTDIDAAKYYKPEFEFAGPQPVQPAVSVSLPNGTVKTIYIGMVSQNMRVEQDQIVVTSSLRFSDQAPGK